jgi:hypothetical protein
MSINKVRDIELMSIPVLSEGLVFGKCGMTDIDLSCDWQGDYFVFVELKYGKSPLTRGQKYHLEWLVDAIVAGGKGACAILAHHQTEKGLPIMAKDATVSAVYMGNQWVHILDGNDLLGYMTELHTTYQRNR